MPMRRLDVLILCLAVLLSGGGAYILIRGTGIDAEQAGIWASFGLAILLMGWVFSYLRRVLTGQMAMHEQSQAYQIAALQERLQTLTPEELAAVEDSLSVSDAPDSSQSL